MGIVIVPYIHKKTHKKAKPLEETAQASDMLPFINIHYLTPSADRNMVIRDYLNKVGICTLDFIVPLT